MPAHTIVMKFRESTGPLDTPWGGDLRNIERRVREGDKASIRARWESGQHMLTKRVGKQLPKGLLTLICAELNVSQREVSRRVQFALACPTETELSQSLNKFSTWNQIVTKVLPLKPTEKIPEPVEQPPFNKSRVAVQQRRDLMRTMAADDYTSRQIAAAVGVSEPGCRAALRKAGIDVPADRVVGRSKHHDSTRIIEHIVMDAEYLTADRNLINLADLDPARCGEWITSLTASRKALDVFIQDLVKAHPTHGKANAKPVNYEVLADANPGIERTQ